MFSGEWIDRIIGLENVTVEVVMARAPDGTDMFEVVRFHSPSAGAQELAPAANRPGLRHVAFKVDNVRGVVDRVRKAGWESATVGFAARGIDGQLSRRAQARGFRPRRSPQEW
jgi:catechol 2,3-dioxygenase-like lactoylglutathione lyase family enzyme